MKKLHIGLLSAMPEEVGKTLHHLKNVISISYGDLVIHKGEWIIEKSTNAKIFISFGNPLTNSSLPLTSLIFLIDLNINFFFIPQSFSASIDIAKFFNLKSLVKFEDKF